MAVEDKQVTAEGMTTETLAAEARGNEASPELSGAPNLHVETYDNLDALADVRGEWDVLLGAFSQATVFSSWRWLVPWWRAFSRDDQMRVLALRDSSSSLVALAPLAITRQRFCGQNLRVLRFMGDGSHDSDNLDMPVRPGWDQHSSRAVLDWVETHAKEWDICSLHTLPSCSPMGKRILEALAARRWTILRSSRPQSVVNLPQTWDAYLKSLSSKERGKIGIRTRKLEKKYRLEIRKCTEVDELDRALAALYELHSKHWQSRGWPGTLSNQQRRQFYREMGSLLLADKRLQFWLLELDGRIVAAQFGLQHGTTVFSLQEGFDPDYDSDSVGYVLRAQAIKAMIGEGIRRYDFLGGTDDSKLRWGAQVDSYLNLDFARPRTRGSLCLLFTRKGQEKKAWLRDHLPSRFLRLLKALRP